MKIFSVLILGSLLLVGCPMSEEYYMDYSDGFVMAPFAFTLPEGWTAERNLDGAYITFAGEEATLLMTLDPSDALPTEEDEVVTTEEGIQIYNIGCGGPYYCGNLAYEGQAYDYTFDFYWSEDEGRVAESALIAPESIVTHEELEAFIATVHLADLE
jgi:hypothetical protein